MSKRRGKRSNRATPDGTRDQASIFRVNAKVRPEFMVDYNRRFARSPLGAHNAHRPMLPTEKLERVFTWQEERRLTQNLTLHYKRVLYLVEPNEFAIDVRTRQTERDTETLAKKRLTLREEDLVRRSMGVEPLSTRRAGRPTLRELALARQAAEHVEASGGNGVAQMVAEAVARLAMMPVAPAQRGRPSKARARPRPKLSSDTAVAPARQHDRQV